MPFRVLTLSLCTFWLFPWHIFVLVHFDHIPRTHAAMTSPIIFRSVIIVIYIQINGAAKFMISKIINLPVYFVWLMKYVSDLHQISSITVCLKIRLLISLGPSDVNYFQKEKFAQMTNLLYMEILWRNNHFNTISTRKSVDGEPSHIPALIKANRIEASYFLRTITYVSFSFLAPKT